MNRPTVLRLLELQEPPRYVRRPSGSKLDSHKDAIADMLDQDAEVPATVILDHLRKDGYAGGITILKQHVASVRPAFLAARSYQRVRIRGELDRLVTEPHRHRRRALKVWIRILRRRRIDGPAPWTDAWPRVRAHASTPIQHE